MPPDNHALTTNRTALILVFAICALLPFELRWTFATLDTAATGYNRRAVLHLFDIPLLALAASAVKSLLSDGVPKLNRSILFSNFGLLAALTLVLAMIISFIANPHSFSAYHIARVALIAPLAATLGGITRPQLRTCVITPLLLGGAVQGVVAVLQAKSGHAIGTGLGECTYPYVVGGVYRPCGTVAHPNVLAAFATLTAITAIALPAARTTHIAKRALLLSCLFATGLALNLSLSRSAAIGTVIGTLAVVIASLRTRTHTLAVVILLVGLVIPTVIAPKGWDVRLEQTFNPDRDVSSAGRTTQISDSLDIIKDQPWFGVGAGRYAKALEKALRARIDAVHSVPLLIAAENGVWTGVLYTLLMLILAWRAATTSLPAFAIASSLAGFMAFDKLTWLHPNGLVMFGLWLGLLDFCYHQRQQVGFDAQPAPDRRQPDAQC